MCPRSSGGMPPMHALRSRSLKSLPCSHATHPNQRRENNVHSSECVGRVPCVHYLGPSARAHDLTQHATAITRAGGPEEGAAARLCVAGEWGQGGGGQDGGACVRGALQSGVLCGWVVHAGFCSQLHGPVTWSEGRLTVPHDATAIFGQLRRPAAPVSLRAWVDAEDPESDETSGSVTSSRGLPPSSAFQTFRWRSWVA